MKYLIKFIVLCVTWPFILLVLIFASLLWLGFYAWGTKVGTNELETELIKPLAYCLWHFKTKEDVS